MTDTVADAPATEQQEAQEPTTVYTDAELKLTEKAQSLLNQRGTKYTIGADRVRAYVEIISSTENFLQGVSKAQMRRIATGEERVPRALTEKYKESYFGLKPHWHWLKGIIAVAFASGYEPPKAPDPVETDDGEGEGTES